MRPLPETALTAAGFLSVQRLPESATSRAPVSRSTTALAASEAIVTMFIPIASPVVNSSRTKTEVPAIDVVAATSRPWRVVASAAVWSSARCASTQRTISAACATDRAAKTGARVIRSAMIRTSAPPARVIAAHPRLTEATSAPSVVASGSQ